MDYSCIYNLNFTCWCCMGWCTGQYHRLVILSCVLETLSTIQHLMSLITSSRTLRSWNIDMFYLMRVLLTIPTKDCDPDCVPTSSMRWWLAPG